MTPYNGARWDYVCPYCHKTLLGGTEHDLTRAIQAHAYTDHGARR